MTLLLTGVSDALHSCRACIPADWGKPWQMGSAAFWIHLAQERKEISYRLADSFTGEVVACMLGGAGVPGDVSTAAYRALREAGLFVDSWPPTKSQIEEVLNQPMQVPGRRRPIRYRFWRQRSARIAAALSWLRACAGNPAVDPRQADTATDMRDRLLVLAGVGPKTASWIVRNHLGSDEVAIIDIHIARAGVSAGIFCPHWQLPIDYSLFESAFLSWASAGKVRASVLDAVIWRTLADMGGAADLIFGMPRTAVGNTPRAGRS